MHCAHLTTCTPPPGVGPPSTHATCSTHSASWHQVTPPPQAHTTTPSTHTPPLQVMSSTCFWMWMLLECAVHCSGSTGVSQAVAGRVYEGGVWGLDEGGAWLRVGFCLGKHSASTDSPPCCTGCIASVPRFSCTQLPAHPNLRSSHLFQVVMQHPHSFPVRHQCKSSLFCPQVQVEASAGSGGCEQQSGGVGCF